MRAYSAPVACRLIPANRSSLWALSLGATLTTACGGATLGNQNYDPNQAANNYAGAGITAAVAGVAWVAGGGCRFQGCPYGSFCDNKTGYCVAQTCAAGCPDGTVCNEGLDRCQAAPPAETPRDTLPQDDARNLPTQN